MKNLRGALDFVSAVTILLLVGAAPALAQSPTYNFATTFQSAKNYDGEIFDLNASLQLTEATIFIPGVRRLQRSYGATEIGETTPYIGHVQKFGGGLYFVNEVTMTPKAQIAPEWSLNSQPHYAFGANDVGMTLAFAKYATLDSGSFGPNYYRSLSEKFAVSASSNFVRTDRWLASALLQTIYKTPGRTEARLIYAGGETLEAAGLQARFQSLTLDTMFALTKAVRLGFGLTSYESTMRSENSALLKIEVR